MLCQETGHNQLAPNPGAIVFHIIFAWDQEQLFKFVKRFSNMLMVFLSAEVNNCVKNCFWNSLFWWWSGKAQQSALQSGFNVERHADDLTLQIPKLFEIRHKNITHLEFNVVSPTSTPDTHLGKELIGNLARATPQHKAQDMHCEHDRLWYSGHAQATSRSFGHVQAYNYSFDHALAIFKCSLRQCQPYYHAKMGSVYWETSSQFARSDKLESWQVNCRANAIVTSRCRYNALNKDGELAHVLCK